MKTPKYIRKSCKTIFTVKVQSGLQGWRARLQASYNNYPEFLAYCLTYGLHKRLGKRSKPITLWEANPVIEGSVNPSDFRKVCD